MQRAHAFPKDEDLWRMDPNANPVNTIPILMAPANKLNTVARVPLSPMAEFKADPSTGHAKPRTKLNNQDAPTALVVCIRDDVDVIDSRDGVSSESAFHVMSPYAILEVLKRSNSNP